MVIEDERSGREYEKFGRSLIMDGIQIKDDLFDYSEDAIGKPAINRYQEQKNDFTIHV
jgi:hypothetical protein